MWSHLRCLYFVNVVQILTQQIPAFNCKHFKCKVISSGLKAFLFKYFKYETEISVIVAFQSLNGRSVKPCYSVEKQYLHTRRVLQRKLRKISRTKLLKLQLNNKEIQIINLLPLKNTNTHLKNKTTLCHAKKVFAHQTLTD